MEPDSAGTQAWSARIARRWSALAEDVRRRLSAAPPPDSGSAGAVPPSGRASSYPPVQRLPAPALRSQPVAADLAFVGGSSPGLAGAGTTRQPPPVQRAAVPEPASDAAPDAPARGGMPRVSVEELAERVYRRLYDELWLARERGG